jgi:hypothetical protein
VAKKHYRHLRMPVQSGLGFQSSPTHPIQSSLHPLHRGEEHCLQEPQTSMLFGNALLTDTSQPASSSNQNTVCWSRRPPCSPAVTSALSRLPILPFAPLSSPCLLAAKRRWTLHLHPHSIAYARHAGSLDKLPCMSVTLNSRCTHNHAHASRHAI